MPYRTAALIPRIPRTLRGKLRTLRRHLLVIFLTWKPMCHVCHMKRHRSRMTYHGGGGGPMRWACHDGPMRWACHDNAGWLSPIRRPGMTCLSRSERRRWL